MNSTQDHAQRILVVDDEANMRETLDAQLGAEGWLVELAASSEEALARDDVRSFDVLVLDQSMPGMSGLDLARRLMGGGFEAPIILFSAYLCPELRDECRDLGVLAVDKINWQELVLACRSLESCRIALRDPVALDAFRAPALLS